MYFTKQSLLLISSYYHTRKHDDPSTCLRLGNTRWHCARHLSCTQGHVGLRAVALSVCLRASLRVYRLEQVRRARCLPPAQSCEPSAASTSWESFKCYACFRDSGTPQPTLRNHHGREQGRVNREDSTKTRGQSEREGKRVSLFLSLSRVLLPQQIFSLAVLERSRMSRTTPMRSREAVTRRFTNGWSWP